MFNGRWKLSSHLLICGILLSSSSHAATAAPSPVAEQDGNQSSLQSQLDTAEFDFKEGKIDVAINQATQLLGIENNSFLQSDQVAQDAKADLAVFQLKAGHPDVSAKLIRELLLALQLQSPMDPSYATNPAGVYATTPQFLKDYFGKVIERLKESGDTKAIIESLVDNTVPKNYPTQLKTYCKRLQTAIDAMKDLQPIAEAEALRYGDPISSLANEGDDTKGDPRISAAKLDKPALMLNQLATQAQQMPVGDARAALGLYTLALVANSAQRYQQAEAFATQSIDHVRALNDDVAGLPDMQVALAYALVKQGKTDKFNALKTALLKDIGDRERLLFAMARFCETIDDDSGALAIYELALANRKKHGTSQPPEWLEHYNALVAKNKPQ